METTIYIPDITCESCEKLITRKLKNEPHVQHWEFNQDNVTVEHDETLTAEKIISLIKAQGFRASTEPFEFKTVKERMRDFRENGEKYEIEKRGIAYAFITFLFLFIIEAVAYLGFLNEISNFIQRFGVWLLYLNISIAGIGFAIYHVLSYKTKITCMIGMMIGMTFGMQAGLLIGAVVGATNGFFMGAMTGMVLGVFIGAIMGKCAGIMGAMEGMMAGVMGGTMGAMISFMMLSDHILLFMPVYVLINLIIIGGLSYLFIQEVVDGKEPKKKPVDLTTFLAASIIITAVLVAIIAYGPRSALLGG